MVLHGVNRKLCVSPAVSPSTFRDFMVRPDASHSHETLVRLRRSTCVAFIKLPGAVDARARYRILTFSARLAELTLDNR